MLTVIGATLPTAVAIAVSPIPIIAVILMLMSPRAVRLSSAFALGWVVGILLSVTVFTLAADAVPAGTAESQPVLGTVQILLGVALLALGWGQWRSRPAPGTTAELPAWMGRIDQMSTISAIGLGFALAAANPKNLLVAGAAGATIGREGLAPGQTLFVLLLFSVIAAATVLVPVLLAVLAPAAMSNILGNVRDWLAEYNTVIMMVLLVVLGMNVLGDGIGAFQ